MAAKPRDMSDSMHYESRQIRDALAASNARLKSVRSGRVPADLQPQLGAIMLQEWEGLSGTGHLDQDDTLASGNPLYQQMRAALLAFEAEVGYAAPARERAFFSALRTQLMDAGALRDAAARDMQITATFKWFSRHKPQGPEADPVTAAVLASSLAVEANAAPPPQDSRLSFSGTPQQQQQQQQQQRLPSPTSPRLAQGGGPGSAAAMPGPHGKHYFFDVYSRAPVGGGSGAPGSPVTAAAAPLPSSSGAGAGLRPTSATARGPSPGPRPAVRSVDDGPSLSVNHPLAMYPSVAGGGLGAAAASGGGADKTAATSAAAGGGGVPRARFAATELYAPAKLIRPQELDELDHRAAQVAAAAAAAGVSGAVGDGRGGAAATLHPKPWVSGPHKPNVIGAVGTLGAGGAAGGPGRGGGGGGGPRRTSRPGAEEEEEVQVLRAKWSAMEMKTNKSVADVQAKVAEWTLQRARLEEEIVRRQEAGRIPPLLGTNGGSGAGAAPWHLDALRRSEYDDAGGMGAGSNLSPYAHANADLAAATAAAAAGPGAAGFPTGGLHGAAAAALGASMRQRHADVTTYDRGRGELVHRLNSVAVPISGDALDRALRPLEDRPFLDCIARLPKPGEHLASRPGSVRLPAARKKAGRSKSAGKKRPPSGRS